MAPVYQVLGITEHKGVTSLASVVVVVHGFFTAFGASIGTAWLNEDKRTIFFMGSQLHGHRVPQISDKDGKKLSADGRVLRLVPFFQRSSRIGTKNVMDDAFQ